MAKWLTQKQKEFADIVKTTEGRSPFAMDLFVKSNPTANQLHEFNKMMKPIGKKLYRKGHSYQWK